MKYKTYAIVAIAAALTISCNKQKSEINDAEEATTEAIDKRKDQVDANADRAIKQTEENAEIDKANIEAAQDKIKAQLDADKKKAEADAEAAKAKVDALDE